MKKQLLIFALLFTFFSAARAQQTAMQFSGLDCNGNNVDLFADLNAGKAVVLFYYMPNCGACPPPAYNIQRMCNNIMVNYPGVVKGYAFPFQNSTTCSYSSSWVSSNNLTMYAPMDSGATQVAYYGGFGMPTVVLVGGTDHRVMFSTLSFTNSDTTIMRDSILNMLGVTGITENNGAVDGLRLFPSPAVQDMQVEMTVKQSSDLKVEVINVLGETVSVICDEKSVSGNIRMKVPAATWSNGVYFLRVHAGEKTSTQKFIVAH